jgi:hypothetical protein
MSISGGISSGLRKFEIQTTIGSTAGVVNLAHNLGTVDFTYYVNEDSTGNAIMIPIRASIAGTDVNNATIEATFTDRLVNITMIG